MPQVNFYRSLVGSMSGVQVNIPVDTTDRMPPNIGDGVVAVVAHLERGRIDKPFFVDRSKVSEILGRPKSIRTSSKNKDLILLYEALLMGASGVVVSRVASNTASLKWITIKHGTSPSIIVEGSKPNASASWIVSFQLKNAINDGVYVSVKKSDIGADYLTITIQERAKDETGSRDTDEGRVLYEITGSTDVSAQNDYGQADDLASVSSRLYGDEIEWHFTDAVNARLKSSDVVVTSGDALGVVYYADSGTVGTEEYQKAAESLGQTQLQYRYLMTTADNTALTQAMIGVGIEFSRKVIVGIDGKLTPKAAIALRKQFNHKPQESMYATWIWSPIARDDPTGVSGNLVLETIGIYAGYSCARNMVKNGYGLEALNKPVAGKDYMLTGTNMKQIYFPTKSELAELAQAGINPVLYETYHDGSGFVFADSLSGAKKTGISKLNSATEIVIWCENKWGEFSNSLRQLPMTEAIRRAEVFTTQMLRYMVASQWLTPSVELGGRAFTYRIYPNEQYPDDRLEIELGLSIDGVVRQVIVNSKMYSRK